MRIGVPKEIKPDEQRAAATPAGVELMVKAGHQVTVEQSAGLGSGYGDDEYVAAGATMADGPERIFAECDMVLHVKEPQESEIPMIRRGQVVLTYLHLAADRHLTEALLKTGCIGIAYETVQRADGSLPLLIPMSEVAGRLAAQQAAKHLEAPQGGRGILMGGVPGVEPATVVVLGGGIVGTQAARIACGMGARVYILDTSLPRLRCLDEVMPANCQTVMSSPANVRRLVREADAVIGAVLIAGAKAPHLITRDMLKTMKPGAVLVDVAIDQGGCFETSHPTTHAAPVFTVDGIVHYCVANMPGCVPLTSTPALTNATLPYILEVANQGWKRAAAINPEIQSGVNLVKGKVTYGKIAALFDLDHTPIGCFLD